LADKESSTVVQQHPRLGTDGQGFKRLIKAALAWLQYHQNAINVLNVYPVPDGDTGTNMVLTMQSAWNEIKDSPEHNVGRVAHRMAHGALMGARGNSGVILSQVWRGFARSLDGKKVYRAPELAAACREAGMLRHMRGEPIAEDAQMADAVHLIATEVEPGEAGYGYDVQFLIVGQSLDVDQVRQRITEMGECPLVVGDPETVKVHVHVPDPGVPISYGAGLGSLRDVVVEDMQAQYRDFIAERDLTPAPATSQEIGVVAVVMGDGLASVFQSLGVEAIVRGGQTMNPSTQDLLEAAESLPARQVILLPNNGNVILAAEQACELGDKPIAVVPSRSIPQGLAALLAINYQADFETNVDVMASMMEDVKTGEVTTATRSATINGVKVTDGQIIGLHDGDLKVAGTKVEQVVLALLAEMDAAQCEIITLYYGADVSEDDAIALADLLQQTWSDQEIEVVFGGQPHYHYILSVE